MGAAATKAIETDKIAAELIKRRLDACYGLSKKRRDEIAAKMHSLIKDDSVGVVAIKAFEALIEADRVALESDQFIAEVRGLIGSSKSQGTPVNVNVLVAPANQEPIDRDEIARRLIERGRKRVELTSDTNGNNDIREQP